MKKFTSIDSLQYMSSKLMIETGTLKKIERILIKAQNQSSMIGIIGEEGIGKSTSAAKYVLANRDVFYVRMGQSYNSKTLFHELVFLITGKEVYRSTNLKTSIDILSLELTQTPTKKLIIIDDAGKLKSSGLGLFHELRENTRATTSFAFLGLKYFMDNLIQWSKEGKVGIAEFYRRVDYWYSLPYLTYEEKAAYIKGRGLELNSKLAAIAKEVDKIWELEARINVYEEEFSRRKNLKSQ